MLLACAWPIAAAVGAAPPGATARCRDGSYSYSQHHSGTCSHHGGVAVWLDGERSARAEPGPTRQRRSSREADADDRLHARADPDRRCSPGAYYSRLTKSVICSPTFRTSNYRNVPVSEKHADEQEYGLAPRPYGSTLEIDHIVSLELGGSNSVANLFPKRRRQARATTSRTGSRTNCTTSSCSGQIGLRSAQRQIAANWQALYKKVFGSPA